MCVYCVYWAGAWMHGWVVSRLPFGFLSFGCATTEHFESFEMSSGRDRRSFVVLFFLLREHIIRDRALLDYSLYVEVFELVFLLK